MTAKQCLNTMERDVKNEYSKPGLKNVKSTLDTMWLPIKGYPVIKTAVKHGMVVFCFASACQIIQLVPAWKTC